MTTPKQHGGRGDYEDAFLHMREKYMEAQRTLQQREEAWRLEKVRLRKEAMGRARGSSGLDASPDGLNVSASGAAATSSGHPAPGQTSAGPHVGRPASAGALRRPSASAGPNAGAASPRHNAAAAASGPPHPIRILSVNHEAGGRAAAALTARTRTSAVKPGTTTTAAATARGVGASSPAAISPVPLVAPAADAATAVATGATAAVPIAGAPAARSSLTSGGPPGVHAKPTSVGRGSAFTGRPPTNNAANINAGRATDTAAALQIYDYVPNTEQLGQLFGDTTGDVAWRAVADASAGVGLVDRAEFPVAPPPQPRGGRPLTEESFTLPGSSGAPLAAAAMGAAGVRVVDATAQPVPFGLQAATAHFDRRHGQQAALGGTQPPQFGTSYEFVPVESAGARETAASLRAAALATRDLALRTAAGRGNAPLAALVDSSTAQANSYLSRNPAGASASSPKRQQPIGSSSFTVAPTAGGTGGEGSGAAGAGPGITITDAAAPVPAPNSANSGGGEQRVLVAEDLAAIDRHLLWGGGGDATDPLKAAVTERGIRDLVAANARLRAQLADLDAATRRQAQEAALHRSVMDRQEVQLQQMDHQVLIAVQERDAAVAKAASSAAALQTLHQQLEAQRQQLENGHGLLEQQCRELRSKLLADMDRRDSVERALHRAEEDAKEATVRAAAALSRATVAEAARASQQDANEALLIELRNVTAQLEAERKNTLRVARDVQVAGVVHRRVEDLENALAQARDEKRVAEAANLQILHDAAKRQDAIAAATLEAVGADLSEAREAAAHWERVSLLQFRELEQMAAQRREARAEAEALRAVRDEAQVQLVQMRAVVENLEAKLLMAWPTHDTDAAGLTVEQMQSVFARFGASAMGTPGSASPRRFAALAASMARGAATRGDAHASPQPQDTTGRAVPSPVSVTAGGGALQGVDLNSSEGPILAHHLVSELQAANAALAAENDGLRLQNAMLHERLESLTSTMQHRAAVMERRVTRAVRHETQSLAVVSKQTDRIAFLEAQVRAARGEPVPASLSLDSIAADEVVFEVFLGSLLLEPAFAQTYQADGCVPSLLAALDFLLHETAITQPVLASAHSAFDQTFAFRMRADALLLHNLSCGVARLELHATAAHGEGHELLASGTADLDALLAAASEPRPALRTHVVLRSRASAADALGSDAVGPVLAKLELVITSRAPFPASFVRLCADAIDVSTSDDNELALSGDVQHMAPNNGPNTSVSAGVAGRRLFQPRVAGGGAGDSQNHLAVSTISSISAASGAHQAARPPPNGAGSSAVDALKESRCGGSAQATIVADLMAKRGLRIEFGTLRINFQEAECPVLALWYSHGGPQGTWVTPTAATGRYESRYGHVDHHVFSTAEALVAALRAATPLVAFDEAEQDPTHHWAVGSLALDALLLAPSSAVELELPLRSGDVGGRERAVLQVRVSLTDGVDRESTTVVRGSHEPVS